MIFGVAGLVTFGGAILAIILVFIRSSWQDAQLDVSRRQWKLEEERSALITKRNDIKHHAWCDFAFSVAHERLKRDHPNAMPGSPYSSEYRDAAYTAPLYQLQMEAKEYGIEYIEPDTSEIDKRIDELTKQLIRLGAK